MRKFKITISDGHNEKSFEVMHSGTSKTASAIVLAQNPGFNLVSISPDDFAPAGTPTAPAQS